jgi:hypothetical protein
MAHLVLLQCIPTSPALLSATPVTQFASNIHCSQSSVAPALS